jgi:hypothetical protein
MFHKELRATCQAPLLAENCSACSNACVYTVWLLRVKATALAQVQGLHVTVWQLKKQVVTWTGFRPGRCTSHARPHLMEQVLHGPADDAVMVVAIVRIITDDILLARHGVRLARACTHDVHCQLRTILKLSQLALLLLVLVVPVTAVTA